MEDGGNGSAIKLDRGGASEAERQRVKECTSDVNPKIGRGRGGRERKTRSRVSDVKVIVVVLIVLQSLYHSFFKII